MQSSFLYGNINVRPYCNLDWEMNGLLLSNWGKCGFALESCQFYSCHTILQRAFCELTANRTFEIILVNENNNTAVLGDSRV